MNIAVKLFVKCSFEAKQISFLLDVGYDNYRIQKRIRSFRCLFTMKLRSTRSVGGLKAENGARLYG